MYMNSCKKFLPITDKSIVALVIRKTLQIYTKQKMTDSGKSKVKVYNY